MGVWEIRRIAARSWGLAKATPGSGAPQPQVVAHAACDPGAQRGRREMLAQQSTRESTGRGMEEAPAMP